MFAEIKKFRESNPIKEARQKKYEELTGRMDFILKKYSGYKPLKKVTKYLENGKNDWFTCILHENGNGFMVISTVIMQVCRTMRLFQKERSPILETRLEKNNIIKFSTYWGK